MKLLLDTYVAIWALNDDPMLSERARELLLDPDNTIFYSTVSVWEVQLKHERRPENIPFNEAEFCAACQAAGFLPLGLADKHVLTVRTLSRPAEAKAHNDPFDRLLLSQAKAEGFFLVTHDALIPGYGENCILSV